MDNRATEVLEMVVAHTRVEALDNSLAQKQGNSWVVRMYVCRKGIDIFIMCADLKQQVNVFRIHGTFSSKSTMHLSAY